MRPRPARPLLAAVLIAPLLWGCDTTQTAPVCPGTGILAEAARLTVLRQGAPRDPSGELYTVRLTGAKTDCTFDKTTNQSDSTLDLTFHASRAPIAAGATYSVQYFVAITQGAHVLSKQLHTISFSFAPGAQTADFTDHVSDLYVHQDASAYGGFYQLTAGLQITDADRAYNAMVGRYVP
jgi:hypothetical protein